MIIGLDIGTYSVKAVVLDPKKKYQVVEFAEAPLLKASIQPVATPPPTPVGEEDPPWAEADDPTGEFDAPGEGVAEGGVEGAAAEEGEASAASVTPQRAWLDATRAIMGQLPESDTIVMSLPWGKAVTIKMDVPFDDRSKVEVILPPRLKSKLPLPLEQVVYDFNIQPTGEDAHEALIAFARRADVENFLADLDQVGVDPMILGVPEMMLHYVAQAHIPEYEEGTFALVDMGHETTRVLVCRDGKTVLARSMSVGGEEVTRAICDTFRCSEDEAVKVKHAQAAILGVSEAQDPSRAALSDAIKRALEPLLRDLRRSFKSLYASERVQLTKIYVTGGGSQIANLTGHLTREFGGVPVELLSLSQSLDSEQILPDAALSKMPLALGLALQQKVDRGRQRLLDLRQGDLTYKGRSSYLRGQLIRYGAAAAILFVFFLGALFMKKRDLDVQRDAMRAAVSKETKKVFGAPVWRAADIKERAESEEEADGGFVPKMSAYEVFYQITDKISDGITVELSRIEVDADRNLIQIYGKTNTPQAVDQIVSDLEKLDCLKSIKKDKLQVKSDSEVNFELQISSACS